MQHLEIEEEKTNSRVLLHLSLEIEQWLHKPVHATEHNIEHAANRCAHGPLVHASDYQGVLHCVFNHPGWADWLMDAGQTWTHTHFPPCDRRRSIPKTRATRGVGGTAFHHCHILFGFIHGRCQVEKRNGHRGLLFCSTLHVFSLGSLTLALKTCSVSQFVCFCWTWWLGLL